MINTAEKEHILTPGNGSTIFEGTVGSTGISLAMMAKARGYNAWIVMPDDVALEKSQLLEKLGAHVEKVRPVSIVDKNQFVNLAKRRAQEFGKDDISNKSNGNDDDESSSDSSQKTGFFADQFENLANFNAHFTTTGPEIYRQTQGNVDAIVMGAGKVLASKKKRAWHSVFLYYMYSVLKPFFQTIPYRNWRNARWRDKVSEGTSPRSQDIPRRSPRIRTL
jgi:cysteine synthase A